ncbi:MAG TPA: DMT family transporter [Solirubrobacterales bacterium]|jgi:drug/metabolite transporter (DMT)-like permease|nr:DMT family transporter [Solirubrobacterales bacterium]
MSRRAWGAFAAVSVLWGLPYLFIKIADDGGMPPLDLAWMRIALGAAVLVTIAWRAGTLPSLRGHWPWLLAFAVAEIAIPFPMIAAGETRVASSTAAILIATTPLLIAVLSLRFEPSERVTGFRLLGLLAGLAGVAFLVGVDVSGDGGELLGVGAVLIAACGYASGPLILKRKLADLDPTAMMGACLVIAALLLTPLAAIALPGTAPSAGAFASVVVLGLFCTALALVLMAILIGAAGPARASVITYINPVIALALGVVFLGEDPGAGALIGLALILVGSWLATAGPRPEPEPEARLAAPPGPQEGARTE